MKLREKCILVVEDDELLVKVLRFNLQQSGYRVTCASNGAEAWECLQRQEFDMVLTDHLMPEMTGLELCEQLRGSAAHREMPVIMITGKRLELDRQYMRQSAGINAVFSKPFSVRDILQAVDECFAVHQP